MWLDFPVLWAVTMTTSVACEADLSVSQCVSLCVTMWGTRHWATSQLHLLGCEPGPVDVLSEPQFLPLYGGANGADLRESPARGRQPMMLLFE